MSSIEKFYTTQFTIKRMEWLDSSSDYASQGTFYGHIQQATDENLREYAGLRLTKAFVIWCDTSVNVLEEDSLEEGSNKYDVRFKIERNVGSNAHYHLLVEKVDG